VTTEEIASLRTALEQRLGSFNDAAAIRALLDRAAKALDSFELELAPARELAAHLRQRSLKVWDEALERHLSALEFASLKEGAQG
jgi:hypothetical protein